MRCRSLPTRTSQSFAGDHGGIRDEIASTWVGYVGPGIEKLGPADAWSDHTDVRPTMLEPVGLQDDSVQDGRVITAIYARPSDLKQSDAFAALARSTSSSTRRSARAGRNQSVGH
jgi:hypothetical protein